MSGSKFIDSNIWLYLLQNDLIKKQIVLNILQDASNISTQVLNENANVCIKKFKLSVPQTEQHLAILQ
jgi:predicted nucleic acid-binding protein